MKFSLILIIIKHKHNLINKMKMVYIYINNFNYKFCRYGVIIDITIWLIITIIRNIRRIKYNKWRIKK